MNCDPMLSDKDTWHSYLPMYRHFFEPYRTMDSAVLEIGVCAGGSMLMWRDYFLNSRIIGIDVAVRPDALLDRHEITHIQANAYCEDSVNRLRALGPFSVIVEDGTHYENDMQFVCEHYSQLLTLGGLLVLEDVQEMAWLPGLIAKLPTGWFSTVIDMRHVKGRYDDVLLCCWRPVA